jgi:hypothetical protein
MGRFFQKDPSRQEKNLYRYANGNPINFTDPGGLVFINPDLGELVRDAKQLYDKAMCVQHPDDRQYLSTDSIDDLFTDFVCEYGPSHREFGYDAPLTIELAHSQSIKHLRAQFYLQEGKPYSGKGQMGISDFFEAKVLDLTNGFTITSFAGLPMPVTIMDFIGGYDWDVYQTSKGTVRFEISDTKDLVSGTRINFSRSGTLDISIEEYLQNPQKYNRSGSQVPNLAFSFDWGQYNIISVLSEKSTRSRNPDHMSGLGGGTVSYLYAWEEAYEPSWACQQIFYNPRYGLVLDVLPIPNNTLLSTEEN